MIFFEAFTREDRIATVFKVKDQVSLSLQITFIHSESDLLIPVPNVPG